MRISTKQVTQVVADRGPQDDDDVDDDDDVVVGADVSGKLIGK